MLPLVKFFLHRDIKNQSSSEPRTCLNIKNLLSFGGWEIGMYVSLSTDTFSYSSFLLFPQNIQDLSLVAACVSPVSRRYISPRLLKHFSILVLPHLPQTAMKTIFQVIHLIYFLVKNKFNSIV